MFEQIKSIIKNDSIFYSVLIVLVAVFSFGLGRWSVAESLSKLPPVLPIVQSKSDTMVLPMTESLPAGPVVSREAQPAAVGAGNQKLVASKSGTKYHFAWCPGASQIKEMNKIYFDTAALARAAGYTPAANCPGLE